MLDFSLLERKSRRWLCTECDAEGHGPEPEACPCCRKDGTVWASAEHGDDPRTMSEITRDLVEMIADIQRWSYLQ
jgi:hypothetical protein